MLDRDDHGRDVARWILTLPCYVKPPLKLQRDFENIGRAPPFPTDERAWCRVFCRGMRCRAALEYRQSLPALPRESRWHGVLTTDFSRDGCGFLHSEILYPGERLRLILLTGIRRVIEVRVPASRRSVFRGWRSVLRKRRSFFSSGTGKLSRRRRPLAAWRITPNSRDSPTTLWQPVADFRYALASPT